MTRRESRMLLKKCGEMDLRVDLRHYPDGSAAAIGYQTPFARHSWSGEILGYENALAKARMIHRDYARECSTSP